jgi:hypothetical protein
MGTIKYTDKSAEGATELKSWDSGSTKFNGQWAQFMLTDDNLSAVTLEVTVVADSKTKWEYHEPVDGKDNMYTVISVMGGSYVEEIPYSEINSQLLTNTDKDLPEASTSDSTHSASSGSTASVGTGSTSVNVQYTKIGNATVGNITDKTYTGSAIKPTPSVKLNGKTLKKGTDYTLSYKNNTKVGTATVTITGKGDYAGTITKSFKIKAASISKAKVASVSNKVYTGKAIKPTPSVKLGSKTLKKGTDYTVSYSNNIKTGKATITIKGKGNYTGTVKKTFKIVPKKATLSSVTSPKTKNVKISWKKDSQATGYEVVYATNSKFTSGKKTVTVTKNTTTSKTISKLTKGKTYYVKVRSYKTIDGKKVYGSYSTVKKIKCK